MKNYYSIVTINTDHPNRVSVTGFPTLDVCTRMIEKWYDWDSHCEDHTGVRWSSGSDKAYTYINSDGDTVLVKVVETSFYDKID